MDDWAHPCSMLISSLIWTCVFFLWRKLKATHSLGLWWGLQFFFLNSQWCLERWREVSSSEDYSRDDRKKKAVGAISFQFSPCDALSYAAGWLLLMAQIKELGLFRLFLHGWAGAMFMTRWGLATQAPKPLSLDMLPLKEEGGQWRQWLGRVALECCSTQKECCLQKALGRRST